MAHLAVKAPPSVAGTRNDPIVICDDSFTSTTTDGDVARAIEPLTVAAWAKRPSSVQETRDTGKQPQERGSPWSSVIKHAVLCFTIPEGRLKRLQNAPQAYWSHELYVGSDGRKVTVHYSTSLKYSEELARRLLDEPVLGFDMEWKPFRSRGLKGNASLIQLASQADIALFHIAQHQGTRIEHHVAPTLRKILQSPAITKTGVAISNADGRRLKRWLKIEPQGLFELSHLHKVVTFASTEPNRVNKFLVSLSNLTLAHLGLPLDKGKVRCSDWTKPLSEAQKRYAAADAYAGYMLFRIMDVKRRAMDPPPPLPAFVELDVPLNIGQADAFAGNHVGYHARKKDSGSTTRGTPKVPTAAAATVAAAVAGAPTKENAAARVDAPVNVDRVTRQLYSALTALRIQLSRKVGTSKDDTASDTCLLLIASQRPSNADALAAIRGTSELLRIASLHSIDLVAFIARHTPTLTIDDAMTRPPLVPIRNV